MVFYRITLYPDDLSGVDPVGVGDAVVPLQVRPAHAVITSDAAQRVTATDHPVAAVHVIAGTAISAGSTPVIAAVVTPIVCARDGQHLPGIDITLIVRPGICRSQVRQ